MPQALDARDRIPSAFDPDPDTKAASNTILYAAGGFDAATESRLDETSIAQWRGIAVRIEAAGPDHGKAILRLLNPFALREGISAAVATAAIEVYCRDHGLPVTEIPAQAKTIFEGAFMNK